MYINSTSKIVNHNVAIYIVILLPLCFSLSVTNDNYLIDMLHIHFYFDLFIALQYEKNLVIN